MKKLLYVALLRMKLLLKDKTAFIWMLLAPVVFVVILSVAYGNGGSGSEETKYPVSIVNMDNGDHSRELVSMLKDDAVFDIIEEDYDSAKKHVQDANTCMGIIIPQNFSSSIDNGEPESVGILKLQDNESTMALSMVIHNYIYQLGVSVNTGNKTASALADLGKIQSEDKKDITDKVESQVLENLSSPAITYKSETVSPIKKEGLDGLSYTAIGIIVMFIMFFVTGSAGSILEEKDEGTWNRIAAVPAKNYSIMGGYMFSSLIKGWVQVGLLVVISRFVFNINWGNSVFGLILLFTCFLLAIIGLGVALSSFVRTKAQLSIISPIVIMPTCLIAGCMWPREVMPDFVLSISNFVPQTWVMKGMTDLVARGSDISAILLPCVVLLVFAAIFFAAGLTFMRVRNR